MNCAKYKEVEMSKLKKMIVIELGIVLFTIITIIIVKYKIFDIFPRCIVNQYLGVLHVVQLDVL